VIDTDAFGPGKRSEERQYADTIKAILNATLGKDARVRIDRACNVHAKLLNGPWGRSLLALARGTPSSVQAKSVASGKVDTVVIPVSDDELSECHEEHSRLAAYTRVHNFASLAQEAFEWQFTRAALNLLEVGRVGVAKLVVDPPMLRASTTSRAWPRKRSNGSSRAPP
jgi:hypothetical protein